MSKPRVIKDFDKLDSAIQEQIKLAYPNGFYDFLITYTDREGKLVSALPFETDEKYYLVRMTYSEAIAIIEDDDDFDDDGNLKVDVKEEYGEKYKDLDYMAEYVGSSDEDEDEDSQYKKDPKGRYEQEDDDEDDEIESSDNFNDDEEEDD